jgi:hypothetical protein
MNYPFNEGDTYYTINGNCIVQSYWDDQSEELFDVNKMYFATLNEAIYFYKYQRNRDMLNSAVNLIDDKDFFEGFEYFNDEPKLSLIL